MPLITNDIVVLGLIAATLGAVFWTSSRETGFWKNFHAFVPALLLCYLIPGIYNSIGLIDGANSKLYNPVASRVLLMYAAASLSVMLGAVLAFLVFRTLHPSTVAGDTWAGMAALAGSWIGGGANMLAMKEIFHVDATTFGQFAVVDVGVAYAWMAALIWMAGRAARIDARNHADTQPLEALKRTLAAYRAQHGRIATLTDLALIFAIAFGGVGLAHALAGPWAAWLGANVAWTKTMGLAEPFVWVVAISTCIGLGLSIRMRRGPLPGDRERRKH